MGSQLTGIRLQIQNHKTPTEIQSSDIKHCALIEYFLPFFYLMWLQNNNLAGKHTCKRNRIISTYISWHLKVNILLENQYIYWYWLACKIAQDGKLCKEEQLINSKVLNHPKLRALELLNCLHFIAARCISEYFKCLAWRI